MGDTIVYSSLHWNEPITSILLFKDSICYFQHTKFFCGQVLANMDKALMKDKFYDFRQIDNVNYISQQDSTIVLRLKQPKINGDNACNEIIVTKLGVKK